METIKWEEIKGFPNYSVSEEGRVRNNRSGRVLNNAPDKDGYSLVTLYNKPNKKVAKVHRLVGEAFIPNPNSLPQINHLDEVKHNNIKSNLEWSTEQENVEYSQAMDYSLISPEGTAITVFNLRKFCREAGLDQGAMQKVVSGKARHHKGWRKANV